MHCPPSFRFPPLREGNRVGGGSPCCGRGTVWGGALLREGNCAWGWFALLREGNCAWGWFSPLCEGNRAWRTRAVPPAGRGNLQEGVRGDSIT